jgi:hypothetical protein
MENYYQEILQEIQKAIDSGDYEEAWFLLKRELEMPYIPLEVEKKLKEMARDVRSARQEKKDPGEPDLETLLRQLKGQPKSQLAAAGMLCSRNLRECLNEIKDWLRKDPQPEAAALIIDALAEQGIDDEFEFNKNGVEYTFWSSDVIPAVKSEGFRYGDEWLRRWLVHYPQYYEMARTLLIHEVYLFLPLSYEKDEAEDLAYMCLKQVADAMGDQSVLHEVDEMNENLAHLS